MESGSLMKVVLFEHPVCRRIYVFKSNEFYIVFGVLNNIIYVSELSSEVVSGNPRVRKKFDAEPLQHDENIVGIFEFENKYYGVGEFGSIFRISQENDNTSAMDYDIFDDSPEKQDKWVLKDKKNVLKGEVVLNYCLSEKQLALLVNSESKLSLEIIDFFEGTLVKSITIRSPGLQKERTLCTLTWMTSERYIKEFLKNWFLSFEGSDGLFIVTTPEGNILVIDPNESSPEHLYAWPFPAVTSYLMSSSAEDLPERTLMFVTEGNSLLKMSQYGEVLIEYLPNDDNVKAALIKQNLLYISDWSNTIKYCFTECQEKSYSLCVKGILCFGSCDDTFVFAMSRNGEVYIINDNFKPPENEVIIPESSLTAVVMEETAKLEKVNKVLHECDAYVQATNLAMKKLPFSINAQVLYARKLSYTICISLKCLEEGIVIEKNQSWNLFLTLKVRKDVITLSNKMQTNLADGNLLTDIFTFSVGQEPIFDLHITAKLIYTKLPEFAKFIPVIYVGEVYLDPSYFLQPALEVKLFETDSHPTLEAVLRNHDSEMDEQDDSPLDKNESKKYYKLQVEYREEYPAGAIFKWLLSHCKPLWRASLWNQAGEDKKFEVAISGHVVALEDCGTYVIITGKDIHSCYAVKRAILSSVPGSKELSLPNESFKQLEIYERTADLFLHENPSIEELDTLRENFRKTITSHIKA